MREMPKLLSCTTVQRQDTLNGQGVVAPFLTHVHANKASKALIVAQSPERQAQHREEVAPEVVVGGAVDGCVGGVDKPLS